LALAFDAGVTGVLSSGLNSGCTSGVSGTGVVVVGIVGVVGIAGIVVDAVPGSVVPVPSIRSLRRRSSALTITVVLPASPL